MFVFFYILNIFVLEETMPTDLLPLKTDKDVLKNQIVHRFFRMRVEMCRMTKMLKITNIICGLMVKE